MRKTGIWLTGAVQHAMTRRRPNSAAPSAGSRSPGRAAPGSGRSAPSCAACRRSPPAAGPPRLCAVAAGCRRRPRPGPSAPAGRPPPRPGRARPAPEPDGGMPAPKRSRDHPTQRGAPGRGPTGGCWDRANRRAGLCGPAHRSSGAGYEAIAAGAARTGGKTPLVEAHGIGVYAYLSSDFRGV